MRNIFVLPELSAISGQSNILRFRLLTSTHSPFNAKDCVGDFALIDYSDKYGEFILSKPLLFSIGDNKEKIVNFATVELQPNDTLGLHGKYIYQIIIKDSDGKVDIPNQGLLWIYHNIHEEYLNNR